MSEQVGINLAGLEFRDYRPPVLEKGLDLVGSAFGVSAADFVREMRSDSVCRDHGVQKVLE